MLFVKFIPFVLLCLRPIVLFKRKLLQAFFRQSLGPFTCWTHPYRINIHIRRQFLYKSVMNKLLGPLTNELIRLVYLGHTHTHTQRRQRPFLSSPANFYNQNHFLWGYLDIITLNFKLLKCPDLEILALLFLSSETIIQLRPPMHMTAYFEIQTRKDLDKNLDKKRWSNKMVFPFTNFTSIFKIAYYLEIIFPPCFLMWGTKQSAGERYVKHALTHVALSEMCFLHFH